MPRKFVMPENVGEKHPKYKEVQRSLAGQGELPGGISINFGRGAAWLMDLDDARRMEEEGYLASDVGRMAAGDDAGADEA